MHNCSVDTVVFGRKVLCLYEWMESAHLSGGVPVGILSAVAGAPIASVTIIDLMQLIVSDFSD